MIQGHPYSRKPCFFYSKAFPNLERLLSCQDHLDLGPSQACMGPTLDFRCSTAMFFLTIHCWGSNHFDPHESSCISAIASQVTHRVAAKQAPIVFTPVSARRLQRGKMKWSLRLESVISSEGFIERVCHSCQCVSVCPRSCCKGCCKGFNVLYK